MPRRSSSLTQVVDGAIDREINSKYDDVKKVADNIDSVIVAGGLNYASIDAVAAAIPQLTNAINHIDEVLLADTNAQIATNMASSATASKVAAEAARDSILNMDVATGMPGGEVTWDGITLTVPTGYQGSVGDTGIQGIQGIKGDTGDVGPTNTLTVGTVTSGGSASATITGTAPNQVLNLVLQQGIQGIQGIHGIQGDAGKGISTIIRTSGTGTAGTTDTYTITYTDASTSTFNVYNGVDGLGSGDMLKATYDSTSNGKVDIAEVADKWTTGRILTIGTTGKAVDGSGNVSWSLAEIGAQAAGSYQPLDATLTAIAGVTTAADKMIYATGADTFATTTVSAFARTVLDDADAATVRTTIGAQALDADLTAIAGLAGTSGFLKKTAADTWTLDTTVYTANNGTVTGVTGTAPVVSSGGVAPVISLAAGYGDTLNPFASKTANYVLAAPSGSAGVPTFRAITATDIPVLNQTTTGSAATLTTGRTLGITGDITWTSPSFNGSSNVTAAGTLATVNSNVGAFTNANVTVNAKGLVTAISSGTAPVTTVTGTAPIVSSGGAAPVISINAATTSTAGSMSATDKTKLDGVATSANNYVHPTADGDLHVPATGTTNNGKVLTAGATAGSLSWQTIPEGVTDHALLSNIGTRTHAQLESDVALKAPLTSPMFTTPDIGVATGISFNDITALASIDPVAAGIAAVGTSTAVARQDHVHPAQTTITGNAGTATKLAATKTINGVAFDGSANINIEDRLGTAIASAATVTIGTAGLGDYIHITGTTTITSFGTAATAGIRRTLIFDGALTLTHNATSLICVGGTSIVTVAGMVIEVVAETTANWRVVSITHPSISATELGYLDGVTSAIQTQISGKAATSHTHTASNITDLDTTITTAITAQKASSTVYGVAKISVSGSTLTITTI